MTTLEQKITQHYTHGSLQQEILAGLDKSGPPAIDQLSHVDEFHIGGRAATKAVAASLQLAQTDRVLDIGCGIGGTARFLATTFGCQVAGVDLTPEYVSVGNQLNAELGLDGQISLVAASALDMPFPAAGFDRAVMLHVGMNIADKDALFAEVGRVLKPGGLLVLYDVMQMRDAPLAYPVAWAGDAATSFISPVSGYRSALDSGGFEILEEADKRDIALSSFAKTRARLAKGGPPPLGLHIVMGKDAALKVANMFRNIEAGLMAPVQIVARRR